MPPCQVKVESCMYLYIYMPGLFCSIMCSLYNSMFVIAVLAPGSVIRLSFAAYPIYICNLYISQ